MDDGAEMQFFRCENWEAFGEVKSHLITETTDGSCPSSVGLVGSIFKDVLEQV